MKRAFTDRARASLLRECIICVAKPRDLPEEAFFTVAFSLAAHHMVQSFGGVRAHDEEAPSRVVCSCHEVAHNS